MKIHKIDLNTFIPHGHVINDMSDNELRIKTIFNTEFSRWNESGVKMIGKKICGNRMNVPSYIFLPEKYRLPVEINLTSKINAPALHIMFGNGLISLGTQADEGTYIMDISGEPHNPKSEHSFSRLIPFNEYFDVCVIYDFNFMQIKINDETRYYSENETYMQQEAFLKKTLMNLK